MRYRRYNFSYVSVQECVQLLASLRQRPLHTSVVWFNIPTLPIFCLISNLECNIHTSSKFACFLSSCYNVPLYKRQEEYSLTCNERLHLDATARILQTSPANSTHRAILPANETSRNDFSQPRPIRIQRPLPQHPHAQCGAIFNKWRMVVTQSHDDTSGNRSSAPFPHPSLDRPQQLGHAGSNTGLLQLAACLQQRSVPWYVLNYLINYGYVSISVFYSLDL